MYTLEEMYASLMVGGTDKVQAARVNDTGSEGSLEDMYAQRVREYDDVLAANPYGCNQYGEGWKMPHNGMERVRKADLAKKKERKKFFEPTEKKAQARRNTASLVGGDTKKVAWGNNISVEKINQFNEVMAEMQEKYPISVDVIGMGAYIADKNNEGAHVSYFANEDLTDISIKIEINQDHRHGGVHGFGGWRPYNAEEAANKGFTRHNVGVTEEGIDVRSVMIHEYGHALSARCYVADGWPACFRNAKNTAQVQAYVNVWSQWKDVYERAINNKDIQKISEYAKDSPQEFFAECFAARELGEKLPDYINSGLDNVIKIANKKP